MSGRPRSRRRESSGGRLERGPADVAAGMRVAAVIVGIEDLTIRAVTVAGHRLIGRPAREIVGRPLVEQVSEADRAPMVEVFDALREGSIDFYRAHLRAVRDDGGTTPLIAWVQALDVAGQVVAIAAWEEAERLPARSSAEILTRIVAIALVDGSGITRVASVQRDVDGLAPADLVASRLVPPDAPGPLATLARDSAEDREAVSIGYRTSVATSGGATLTLEAVCTALAGSSDRMVLLMLPDPAAPRVRDLEEHLRRIALEIEASGVAAAGAALPGINLAHRPEVLMLTGQQREVLRRLVAGQRVRTIAAELFVSQSTVRNHLSAVFGRFGVHNQAELLERLSQMDEPSG